MFPKIFKVCGGFYNKKPVADKNGKIPFVGATDSHNGFTQFCTVDDIDKTSKTGNLNNASLEKKIFKGNCIAVTNNGSVGYAYYQQHPFTCSHDVNPLYLRNAELNRDLAKFLMTVIAQQRVCFTYVRKWRPMRMKKSKIMLPVDAHGKPDYAFMESYIDEIQKEKIFQYVEYSKKELLKLGDYKKIKALEEVDWKPYRIDTIAQVDSGRDIYDAERVDGDLPYITAGVQQNGIGYFVGNRNKTIAKNIISVNRNGAVGSSFYHEYPALYSNDCRKVILNNYNENKYVSLFMTHQIMMQRKNYNYSRKMGTERLKKQMIMLPALNDDIPDYEYMEQYIKNLMIKKYKEYLEYQNN